MSRIGKLPVTLPKGVSFRMDGAKMRIKGPGGDLGQKIAPGVQVEQQDDTLVVRRLDDSRQARASHGLTRALLNNMVVGVTAGFERRLEIQGVGYKSEVRGNKLVLNLGFSHPVEFDVPKGISIGVEKGTGILIKGADKELVGETAARIRRVRPPDPYKGKGVRYAGERISLKAGKTAKK